MGLVSGWLVAADDSDSLDVRRSVNEIEEKFFVMI